MTQGSAIPTAATACPPGLLHFSSDPASNSEVAASIICRNVEVISQGGPIAKNYIAISTFFMDFACALLIIAISNVKES